MYKVTSTLYCNDGCARMCAAEFYVTVRNCHCNRPWRVEGLNKKCVNHTTEYYAAIKKTTTTTTRLSRCTDMQNSLKKFTHLNGNNMHVAEKYIIPVNGTYIFICKFMGKALDDCTPTVDKWLCLGKKFEIK